MSRMKKDEAIRAALLRNEAIKDHGSPIPMKLNRLTRAQSQAVAIAARRAELSKKDSK